MCALLEDVAGIGARGKSTSEIVQALSMSRPAVPAQKPQEAEVATFLSRRLARRARGLVSSTAVGALSNGLSFWIASRFRRRYRFAAGLLGACVALVNANASGQVVSGGALILEGELYRLWGIDAPESEQHCADGWPVGAVAIARLQTLMHGGAVHCEERERDIYGRRIAVCTAAGKDLGAALLREGLAWPSRQHAEEYFDQQARAKEERLGIHSHLCTPPWIWRAERRRQANYLNSTKSPKCQRNF